MTQSTSNDPSKLGRPTEYKEEYIQDARTYLSECEDKIVVNGSVILKVNLPTIEGFARYIGVNKTSLYEWEKKNPEFSNALNEIRTEQHDRLVNNGLAGTYNSTIAKLILSANHNMREKSDVTSNDEKIEASTIVIKSQGKEPDVLVHE